MNKFTLFLSVLLYSALLSVMLPSCGEDEPVLDDGFEFLSLDGPNRDAPFLPTNLYEAGVKFIPTTLGAYTGKKITDVYVYIKEKPSTCIIKIYKGTVASGPDSLLYSQNVSSLIKSDDWNKHSMTTPVTIDESKDLWITVEFTSSGQRNIGCDPGPAKVNGDWLYDQADGLWLPLYDRSAININWNIRAVVDIN